MMEKQKSSYQIPFKFEYSIVKKPVNKLIPILTVSTMLASIIITSMVSMSNTQNEESNIEKVEVIATTNNNQTKEEFFFTISKEKIEKDKLEKLDKLSAMTNGTISNSYEGQKLFKNDQNWYLSRPEKLIVDKNTPEKDLLSNVEIRTVYYQPFSNKEYELLNNYLKAKPQLYVPTIKVLEENNYNVIALLLKLETLTEKVDFNHKEINWFLKSAAKIAENENQDPLIIKISQNKLLTPELKLIFGKFLMLNLSNELLASNIQYRQMINSKLNTINDFNVSEEEIDKEIQKALKKEKEQVNNNILALIPDARDYYEDNPKDYNGIAKLILRTNNQDR